MKSIDDIQDVPVEQLPVELHKLLKFENIVSSGGEAKYVIAQGLVTVNGEVETRRGRKLNEGDIVGFQETRLRVVQGDGSEDEFGDEEEEEG